MKRNVESLDRLAFVDIETTGLDASKEEIVEVGVCFVERGSIIARRSWLIRPSKPVPGIITALTGLRDDDLQPAPPFDRKRSEIEASLAGWVLVAHNAEFERSFLGPLISSSPVVDSCEVMHLLFPELPSHALDFLVRWADVGEGARHRALEDAEDTFLVLRAAFERVARAGRRREVERLVRRLSPPATRDGEALVQLLATLSAECSDDSGFEPSLAPAKVRHLVDESLVGRFVASLRESAGTLAVDVERPVIEALLEAARRVAQATGTTLTVAVPQKALREVTVDVVVPRHQVCSTRLRELVESPAKSDEGRLARAWLESWSKRSTLGDLATHSGWMAERHPETRALLQLARGCTCTDPHCFVRRTEKRSDSAGLIVVSHDLALDWLERAAPMSLIVAHAEQLPEAERRRTGVLMHGKRLRSAARLISLLSPGHPLLPSLAQASAWLEHVLEGPVVLIDSHARTQRSWLDTRDLLHGLQKDIARALSLGLEPWSPVVRELSDDLERVLRVPPPGFDVRAGEGQVRLSSTSASAQILSRLRGSKSVLVSAVRGGLRWSGETTAWVPPSVMPWSVEVVSEPLPLPGLMNLVRRLATDGVVTVLGQGAPDAIAEALRATELPFRLLASARSLRGRGVLLGRWSTGMAPPPSGQVMLYGLNEWRAAVVGCGQRHLTLASATGVPDAVSAELADVAAQAGVRRVVAR